MTKLTCSECGTENDSSSIYCLKCGKELKSIQTKKDDSTKTKLTNWWNKQGKNNKILTGAGGCCFGIIVLLAFMMILFPVTSLSIESNQIQINNQTTEYTIQGTSDPNATIKISSIPLNLNEVTVSTDKDGNFSYKLSIPLNVTEADLNITAKSPNKSQSGINVNIQRPLTPLTINPVNISPNATNFVIQGKTDPNASITINCNDLNLTNINLTADEQGNFNKTVEISTNLNQTKIEIKANATGKRINSQEINITREQQVNAPSNNNLVDDNLKTSVTQGVQKFFKDFNNMYDEDGTSTGYLISTISVTNINKVSDSEVDVTVNLNKISESGDKFDSTWSGPFYLNNGKWEDKGDFVQTYSYNENTGEKVI